MSDHDIQTRVDMTAVAEPELALEPMEPPVVEPVYVEDPVTHMQECARRAHEAANAEQMKAGRHHQQADLHARLAKVCAEAASRNRQVAQDFERLAAEEEYRRQQRAQAAQWGRQAGQQAPLEQAGQQWGQPPQGSLADLAREGAPGLPSVAALAAQQQHPQERR